MTVRAPASSEDAFYDQLSPESFQANVATTGPWDAALQHGGPPMALLGRMLEMQGGPDGSRIAHLAFDFFGPVPVSDVTLSSTIVRAGSRIQLSEATMTARGRVVLRAAAWHLLAEAGRSPEVAFSFDVPELPTRETEARFAGMERFPYGEAVEWRFVAGGFDEPGPATVWTRSRIPLVRGHALTGLQRVLIMVDAANGISAVLPLSSWTFVPVDLMVTIQRLPDAAWVGMSSRTTLGADGIGMTNTLLFDAAGVLGHALQTLYVTPR
jgi:Thioesterase-like superfamily